MSTKPTTDPIEQLRAELLADPALTEEEREAFLDNARDAEWRTFMETR